jgi:hypothetical protein
MAVTGMFPAHWRDAQVIWDYHRMVLAAYQRLVQAGFTSRLLAT